MEPSKLLLLALCGLVFAVQPSYQAGYGGTPGTTVDIVIDPGLQAGDPLRIFLTLTFTGTPPTDNGETIRAGVANAFGIKLSQVIVTIDIIAGVRPCPFLVLIVQLLQRFKSRTRRNHPLITHI